MARRLTPEDLYALKQAEDPRISPDGARVAFVRMEIDRESYEYRRSIWVSPVEGGEPRRYTAGPNDRAPRWSPDGKQLAFLRAPAGEVKPANKEERAKGKGQAQIWILPLEGGEPRQLTFLRYGAGAPVWSPDGQTLLFSAETGEPDDPEAVDAALHDKNIPRVRTIDQLWFRLDGHGYLYEQRSHLFTIPLAGGDPRQLTDGDWNDEGAVWSPDGARIAFASDRSDERWRWPGASIWTLNPATGELARLTDEALSCRAPEWSPDGSRIAFLASPRRNDLGHTDLYVVPSDGAPGSERILTQDFIATCDDSCIDDQRAGHAGAHLTWSADGRSIYFMGSQRGATLLFAAIADGSEQPQAIVQGQKHIYGYSLDVARQSLTLAISDPLVVGDVYVQRINAEREPRRLTDLNAALINEVELAQQEEFSFQGADGWQLQGWVMRPPHASADERVPAILQIHGGPAAMYGYSFFMEFQLLAARGYAVVYSNPRGSTGYGRVFSGAVNNDWGGKDYLDVMAGLDAAIARGGIDDQRLGVAGGSYGGFMTNWIVGHTDRFKAGVTMRCVANMATMFGVSDVGWQLVVDSLSGTPWDNLDRLMGFSPITYVASIHTPLLIIHSDNDLRCPISEGEQVYSALKYLGRETKMIRFEGQSHDLSRNGHPRSRVIRYDEILGWFAKYIPAEETANAEITYAL